MPIFSSFSFRILFLDSSRVALHDSQIKIILIFLFWPLVKQAVLGHFPLSQLSSDWVPSANRRSAEQVGSDFLAYTWRQLCIWDNHFNDVHSQEFSLFHMTTYSVILFNLFENDEKQFFKLVIFTKRILNK